jgi:hypothetical protein
MIYCWVHLNLQVQLLQLWAVLEKALELWKCPMFTKRDMQGFYPNSGANLRRKFRASQLLCVRQQLSGEGLCVRCREFADATIHNSVGEGIPGGMANYYAKQY